MEKATDLGYKIAGFDSNGKSFASVIRDGQIIAKWQDEAQRMALAQFYLDYYNNVCRSYIEDAIDGLLSETKDKNELKKWIDCNYLVERFINEVSKVFDEDCEVIALKQEGDEVVKDPDSQAKLDVILDDVQINVVLEQIDRFQNLMKDVHVIPKVNGNEISLDIVTNERCWVEQDENDETQCKAFYYLVDNKSDSPMDSARKDIVNIWEMENGKAVKYEAELNINADGISIIENTKKELKSVEYGTDFPVIHFRLYYPNGEYWYHGNNKIVEKAFIADLASTDARMAEAYNIPQKVRKGVPEGAETKIGRNLTENLTSDGIGDDQIQHKDIKYIHPGESLNDFLALKQDRIKDIGFGAGLSNNSIVGQSATSGYELALSMSKIYSINKRNRKYYLKPLKQLLKVLMIAARSAGYKINPDMDFMINFGELNIIMSDIEKEQARGLKLANNTGNLIDFALEDDPDLGNDREAGFKAVQERILENNRIKAMTGNTTDAEFQNRLEGVQNEGQET